MPDSFSKIPSIFYWLWSVKYDRFGISERQWVEAQVENAKQQAILMTLKSQVSSDEAHIHLDLHSLRYLPLIVA